MPGVTRALGPERTATLHVRGEVPEVGDVMRWWRRGKFTAAAPQLIIGMRLARSVPACSRCPDCTRYRMTYVRIDTIPAAARVWPMYAAPKRQRPGVESG